MKKLHVTIEFDYDVEDDVTTELVEEMFTESVGHWNVYMIDVVAEETE